MVLKISWSAWKYWNESAWLVRISERRVREEVKRDGRAYGVALRSTICGFQLARPGNGPSIFRRVTAGQSRRPRSATEEAMGLKGARASDLSFR